MKSQNDPLLIEGKPRREQRGFMHPVERELSETHERLCKMPETAPALCARELIAELRARVSDFIDSKPEIWLAIVEDVERTKTLNAQLAKISDEPNSASETRRIQP